MEFRCASLKAFPCGTGLELSSLLGMGIYLIDPKVSEKNHPALRPRGLVSAFTRGLFLILTAVQSIREVGISVMRN